jgi:hypothetical protein
MAKRRKTNAEIQHDLRERQKAKIGDEKFKQLHAQRMKKLRAEKAKTYTDEEKARKRQLHTERMRKWRAEKKANMLAAQQDGEDLLENQDNTIASQQVETEELLENQVNSTEQQEQPPFEPINEETDNIQRRSLRLVGFSKHFILNKS